MLINISYLSESGVRNTLGNYDPIKKRMSLFYAESRLGLDKNTVVLMDPGKPGDVEEVHIIDLDYDSRYKCSYKDFVKFPHEDDKVTVDLTKIQKVR
jgi:hypothetical protein